MPQGDRSCGSAALAAVGSPADGDAIGAAVDDESGAGKDDDAGLEDAGAGATGAADKGATSFTGSFGATAGGGNADVADEAAAGLLAGACANAGPAAARAITTPNAIAKLHEQANAFTNPGSSLISLVHRRKRLFTTNGMAILIGKIPKTGSGMNGYIACGPRVKDEIERAPAVLSHSSQGHH
jgi:hypothetical protein